MHADHPYSILYADASARLLLEPGWRLENAQPLKGDTLRHKKGKAYHTTFEFDTTQDGTLDNVLELPAVDLRFLHAEHGGRIFVHSFPLDTYQENLDLEVLGRRLVHSLNGGQWYMRGDDEALRDRRFAALVESAQDVRVLGIPGVALTLTLADVDEMQMNPAARTGSMELILLRPGYAFKPSVKPSAASSASCTQGVRRRRRSRSPG